MPRHKARIPPLTTSPLKKPRPSNAPKPKYAEYLDPPPVLYPESSSSKRKRSKHASATGQSVPEMSRRVEIATPSGTVLTQRWGPGIESSYGWQVPNRYDHVGNALVEMGGAPSPTPTFSPKEESSMREASPQGWGGNIADAAPNPDTPSPTIPSPSRKRAKRAVRNPQKNAAWLHWRQDVIYKAVEIYLDLEAKKAERVPLAAPDETSFEQNGQLHTLAMALCSRCNTPLRFHSVMTIAFTNAVRRTFEYCKCPSNTLPLGIIQCGYFPGSPVMPQIAFHFDILSLFSALNVNSSTPITSFHTALFTILQENGYEFSAKDPFLGSLSEAITWFKALRDLTEVETEREFLLPTDPVESDAPLSISTPHELTRHLPAHNGDPTITTSESMISGDDDIPPSTETTTDSASLTLARSRLFRNPSHNRASPYLRARCLQCFGGSTWGGPVNENPDVIVAMDGNMQHKQYMFVGGEMILPWNETCSFLTRAEVGEAACHVFEARDASRSSSGSRPSSLVPDGAIEECEESHRATKHGRQSASKTDTFRSKGLMATVCRHDIPLFLCDVDTPGEQQHFSIAMLIALSRQLPSNTTIGLMYDVGCVLDRSIAKYNLIPNIAPRLSIAVSVFHAYAHQFCCQIAFHPWKRSGFGKSNGEGNKQLWSSIVDTIAPERMMSPAKRITTIDSKIKLIASRGRDRLASLARSKMGAIHQQEALTTDLLETLKENRGFTPQFLQSQWEAQKTLQLSARAYNDQAGMKKFAKLLEAERSAQAHSDALDAVKKELDRISLARTMSHRPMDLKEHYQAALHVRSLHDESQARLHELTAQIGLSDLKLPQNPSDKEKEYIEKYILARFRKHSILIRLAKYQDEMNPIRSSQRRGGRLVTKVGYTKMVSVLSSANERARIISTQVRQYNELVDYLECSERPPWLPDSLSHTKMNVKELLQMDPSDERWAKMWETLWNSNWSLDEKPPAFVIDQEVCHGIVAVLSLARIKEEKLRLAREELNARTWIVESFDSLVQIVDSIHPLFKYRLRLRLKSLLKCRDSIINGSTPNVNLRRAPIRHLLENLERPDPAAAPSYIDYTSFRLPLPYSSTLPSGNNSIDPDDDVEVRNELSVLDGLIRMSPESDLGGAEDIEPPIDSAGGSDDLDVPGDISDDESEAPLDEPTESAETDGGLHAKPVSPEGLWSAGLDNSNDEQSIEEKFWDENPRPQSLPPITMIIDAIRSPGQSVQEQIPKKIWKEIMELHLPRETERIANDGQTRYYKHISIFCDALPTVNRLRRIHGTIIDTYIEMLKDLTDENLRDVLRTTRPRVIMFPTQCEGMRHHLAVRLLDREMENVRTDLFEVTSWTIPCYSRKRSHWLLGVVNFEKRELRYLDSIPLPETFDISHHGPQWVFAILGQLVDAVWSFVHPTRVFDWSNWGSRVVTKETRQWNGHDCGVWTMADIQAVHIGLDAAPNGTNVDHFRNRVRHQILSLPVSNPRWQPTWKTLDASLLRELRSQAAMVASRFPVDYAQLGIDHTDAPLVMDGEQDQIDLSD